MRKVIAHSSGTQWALTQMWVPDQCPPSAEYKDHTVFFLFKFDCICNPTCVSAIMCPAHLFQCHCISCSFVSVPVHLLLICVSAIASPAHLSQCHCISCSFVSVPLHILLSCVSAIASPAHLCQCHCPFCSLVSVSLHLPLICVSAIVSPAQLCQYCTFHSLVSVWLTLLALTQMSGRCNGTDTSEQEVQWPWYKWAECGMALTQLSGRCNGIEINEWET